MAQSSKLGSKTVSSWLQNSVYFAEVLYLVFGFYKKMLENTKNETSAQGADSPSPLRVAKAGINTLKEEITPLLPTGIGERSGTKRMRINEKDSAFFIFYVHTQIQISRVVLSLKNSLYSWSHPPAR